ncbi:MAG: hypothetical protein NTY41_11205 [Proteobacteria bacterium]|nr:hypothetical protein [Pseudomonadota bacterium]
MEWHKVNQAQLTAFGDKEELSQYKPGTIVSAVLMEDSNGVLSFKKGTTKAHPKKEEEKPLQLALPF